MKRKTKVIVFVEESLLTEAKRMVAEGGYHSLNACVNEALRALPRKLRAGPEEAMEEASRYEMFLADIQRTMEYFTSADAETARRIEKR